MSNGSDIWATLTSGDNKTQATKRPGIGLRMLHRKVKKYKID